MRIVNACRVGDVDRVRAHIAAGGDPNLYGLHRRTLLFVAMTSGQLDVCHMLVKHGASMFKRDQYCKTPADVAHEQGILHVFNTSNDTG